jgi:endo-1,4-beta-xylanase
MATKFKLFLLLSAFIGYPIITVAQDATDKGLRDYYSNYFPIGVAITPQSIKEKSVADFIVSQFNSIPQEKIYNWRDADSIVAFAQAHNIKVRGHNLCWHEHNPDWLFKSIDSTPITKELILQRLKEHINAIVSRYRGKIYAWDVVNEAVDDDTTKLLRNSLWYQTCGDDFITKAFEYAHAADPKAVLFYNDYNTERPEKRERVYQLLKKLVDAGVPINAVGIQAHWSLYEPGLNDLEKTIKEFSSLGLKIQVTEMDISVYPWEKDVRSKRQGEPDAYTLEMQQKQAEKYAEVFKLFRKYKKVITGVTFWNISDKYTWLNHYPVPGRKNYPLLFDENLQPKKAYYSVVNF